jgi:hypothetical protein
MKIRGPTSYRKFELILLSLVVCLSSTGCASFLAKRVMKDRPLKIKPEDGFVATNAYQSDFLYLRKLAEEVVPLADRYFPPDERAAMEQKILGELGKRGCSYETFVFSIRRYLAAFNNQHASVVHNPKPIRFSGIYPFKSQYVSNDLYVIDIAREYDRSRIGQRITTINDQPVSEVEQKMFSVVSAENLRTKRASIESLYSGPHIYRLLGLSSSATNSIKLGFADDPPVSIAPKWKGKLEWHNGSPPPHPITVRAQHQYDCRLVSEQNFAYLQFNACFDQTAILDGLDTYVKSWIRPLIRAWLAFEFHRKKPSSVLRGIYDPERPVFKDYLAVAIREINQQGITNLIIDLRRNSGGEAELCKQLIYHFTDRDDLRGAREFQYNPKVLSHYDPKGNKEFHSWYLQKFGAEPPSGRLLPTPKQERPFFASVTDPASPYHVAPDRPVFGGKIIVLANQNTGSAASLLTGLMQDNRLAMIVGTTTANNATGPTSMTPLKLPRSGIMVSLPTTYVERAMPQNGDILQPDYWVENSVADIQAGRDAAFEKALELFHTE